MQITSQLQVWLEIRGPGRRILYSYSFTVEASRLSVYVSDQRLVYQDIVVADANKHSAYIEVQKIPIQPFSCNRS